MQPLNPDEIRELRAGSRDLRDRDFADRNDLAEAALVAAHVGRASTRIAAHPDGVMMGAQKLGEVMALTRVPACVHEKIGRYENDHPGSHASMVLADAIDLRIFPQHWVHGFAVEKETERGTQRSLQVFDAAGDAVHKIFLRDRPDLGAWSRVKEDLAVDNQSQVFSGVAREPVEAPIFAIEKVDILRKEWARLTDTHHFLPLCSLQGLDADVPA